MFLFYVRAYSFQGNERSRWHVTASDIGEAMRAVEDQLGGRFKVEHAHRVLGTQVNEIVLEEIK